MNISLKLHYFTSPSCSVCDSLLPKIEALILEKFPTIEFEVHPIEKQPEIAAKFGVFTAPVLILTIDNQESERWVRAFGLVQVEEKLNRILTLIN